MGVGKVKLQVVFSVRAYPIKFITLTDTRSRTRCVIYNWLFWGKLFRTWHDEKLQLPSHLPTSFGDLDLISKSVFCGVGKIKRKVFFLLASSYPAQVQFLFDCYMYGYDY